ncbi:NADH dehydrogenase FAD-containing subunit, partial [Natrinema soli]
MTDVTGAGSESPTIRISAAVSSDRGDRVYDAACDEAGSVSVVRTGPTGVDALEPLVLATDGGRTAFVYSSSPSTARELAGELESGTVPTTRADAVVEHDPDVSSLPVPETGPLSVGRRHVLGPCGWVDPLEPVDYPLRSSDRTA